jgi:hypothetical protein
MDAVRLVNPTHVYLRVPTSLRCVAERLPPTALWCGGGRTHRSASRSTCQGTSGCTGTRTCGCAGAGTSGRPRRSSGGISCGRPRSSSGGISCGRPRRSSGGISCGRPRRSTRRRSNQPLGIQNHIPRGTRQIRERQCTAANASRPTHEGVTSPRWWCWCIYRQPLQHDPWRDHRSSIDNIGEAVYSHCNRQPVQGTSYRGISPGGRPYISRSTAEPVKCATSNRRLITQEIHAAQSGYIKERVIPDGCDSCRDGDSSQSACVIERIIPDGCDSCRDGDAGESACT